jgi:hypothetical protein
VSNGLVTSSNTSVNSSAGGLVGYVVNTTISDCYATGDISIATKIPAMIYVGGLAGYAGKGLIQRSYSIGNVSAQSDFPYAGGLVGYNYDGNVISQCYAAEGKVRAIGVNSTNSSYPYAGGLAGYNSGVNPQNPTQVSTIRNSYAHADVYARSVTDTAWAGGITASNANNALIENCYATGVLDMLITSTSPSSADLHGAIAGGIVGYNYFESPQVHNSVALNESVEADSFYTSTDYYVHRVAGEDNSKPPSEPAVNNGLTDNYANLSMVLTPQPGTWDIGTSGLDGESTTTKTPDSTFYSGTLGWNFTPSTGIWKMDSGDSYPLLQWQ